MAGARVASGQDAVSGTHPYERGGIFTIPALERASGSRAVSGEDRLDAVALLTTYLILLFFIPSTLVFGPLGGAGTPAVVASLCIFLWYLASWIAGRIVPAGGGRPLRVAMFLFAVTVLASFVAAMTRDISQKEVLGADRELIILLSWVALVVVITQSVTSYDRLSTLLRRAVIMGSVVGAIGIVQYYTGLDVAKYFQIPGLVPRVDVTTLLSRNGLHRPSSTATQPIEFGVVMAMLLPFALQQAFSPVRPGEEPRRFARWAPVVLIAFGILVSLSRSGIIGAAVALLILWPTWSRRRRIGTIVSTVLGLAVVRVVAPRLIHTFLSYFSALFGTSNPYATAQARTGDYGYVFHYVGQRPLFGMGFGTFTPEVYIFTDNAYLHSLAEIGFVGVAVLLVLYFTGIYCAAVGRRLTRDERRREIGQALVASIAVGVAASATFDALSFPMFTGVFFLIMGAAGAYLGIMRTDASGQTTERGPLAGT
jgi:polysaccharide biosynthesis protein PslJ